jgi:hypothetical protein
MYAEGKDLYYNNNGKKIRIEKIYNRVIFDDLKATKKTQGHYRHHTGLECYMDHSSEWFYRISKSPCHLSNIPAFPIHSSSMNLNNLQRTWKIMYSNPYSHLQAREL